VNPNRRLLVVALAVAALASLLLWTRCSGGDPGATPQAPPTAAAPATSLAAAAPSAAGDHGDTDDGAGDADDSPAAITSGERDAREFAIQLVVKILNKQGRTPEQWRAEIRPYLTAELADLLADADPAQTPVGVVGDRVTVRPAGDALVSVSVPVVDGGSPPRTVATVQVTLSGGSGRWLATELDVVKA
jgi:hypothetical protein